MNRTQARIALLKLTFVVCALLSVLVGVSVWDTRPSHSLSMVPDVVSVVARVPAAIPGLLKEQKPKSQVRPGFQVWKAPCLSAAAHMKSMSTDSGYLRISTHTCDAELQIKGSKLKNVSNGYVATVFTLQPSQLTSDFIPLAEGKNLMQMELTLDTGERFSYEWSIDRQPIATN